MAAELRRALCEVRDTLLEEPVSPRVEAPADVNRHYCRYVAETVAGRLDDGYGVEVLEDGGRGFAHTWLYYAGRHYDAECVDGVGDYRDLPFFQRHPEAVVHVEPGTADPASLRNRGGAPLYPDALAPDAPDGLRQAVSATDWQYAAAGVLLGLVLFALGASGEWAIHGHLLQRTAELQTLILDLEIVGELLVLVSPVVFLVLRPAQRASSR